MAELQTGSHEKRPAVGTDPVHWGRRFFIGILAVAIIGAATLMVSVSRNPEVASQTTTPHYVLVAVKGVTDQPGFAGFLIHIMPSRRTLGIIPIPGTYPSLTPGNELWVDAANMTDSQLVEAVYRDTHIRVGGYFTVTVTTADVMFSFLSTTSDWPPSLKDSPNDLGTATALYKLGWQPRSPGIVPTRAEKLTVLTDVMSDLPELPATEINALQSLVFSGRPTNLSEIQLFILGTVMRGYNLEMEPPPRERS
jgi:hypothetical protein